MSRENDFQTTRTLIDRNATLYPDKVAMREYETGRSTTGTQGDYRMSPWFPPSRAGSQGRAAVSLRITGPVVVSGRADRAR